MGEIRIATWNVNSVRQRRHALRRFIRLHSPDLLCLQETKVVDGDFPGEWFRELGLTDVAVNGQKSYNGVCLLSRLPLSRVRRKQWRHRSDCRHIYATLPNGIEIHNLYVPAGGDLPDPVRNQKFAYKLQFLKDMSAWFRRRRHAQPEKRLVLLGDLNVAPLVNDVWSHERLIRVITHTPLEVEALARLQRSHDWIDAVRAFVPESKKLYSWWSYRNSDWKRADKGRRLDHIWITPALQPALKDAFIVKAARGWGSASDHVPVVVTLECETGGSLPPGQSRRSPKVRRPGQGRKAIPRERPGSKSPGKPGSRAR
jgi:exodeoxyribonuclease-3